MLSKEVLEGLSPGVKDLVVLLDAAGFTTVDSGDGSNFEAGMECATPFPMVAMLVNPAENLVAETKRLKTLLESKGVNFSEMADSENGKVIEAHYEPMEDMAVIVVIGVLSKDLSLG